MPIREETDVVILIVLGILLWLGSALLSYGWSNGYFLLSYPSVYKQPDFGQILLSLATGPAGVLAQMLWFKFSVMHPENSYKWRLR